MSLYTILRSLHRFYRDYDPNPRKKAEQIAHDQNLEVHAQSLEDDISSMIVALGDDLCVVLNSDHPQTRQTFSLAHELCHVLVHHGWHPPIYSRYSLRHLTAERQANSFAAQLLMPAPLMEDLVDEDLTAYQIAERLGLSVEAVTYRLLALNLTTPDVAMFFEEVPF